MQQLALMVYQMYKDSEWKPKSYIDSPLSIRIFNDCEALEGQDKDHLDELINSGMFTFCKGARKKQGFSSK